MKNIKSVVLFLFITMMFFSCKKEFDYGNIENAVKTTQIINVTQTTAEVFGDVLKDNGESIIEKGICYDTIENPSTLGQKVIYSNAQLGSYVCTLTNLLPSKTYYARAYATNKYGTAYGNSFRFTTLEAIVPIISRTIAATLITPSSAKTGGTISISGMSNVITRGVCYSNTQHVPTISDLKTNNGSGIGTFTTQLTGLLPNTVYYIRAFATNDYGIAYGDIKTFKTLSPRIPSGITTTLESSITINSASCVGSILDDGGSPIITRGICYSNTNSLPTIADQKMINGDGIGTFTSNITNLLPNTRYYARAYATNSIGSGYGNVVNFTTLPNLIVGESYQGGIIAYIFTFGDNGFVSGEKHGLIVTNSDLSKSAQWGCSGTNINGTSSLIGSGASNTFAILSGCNSSTNAASLCYNLYIDNNADWYLPSIEELFKIYLNKNTIGGMGNVSYWSSSQNNSTTAKSLNFNSGFSNNSSKNSTLSVRAIKEF